MSVTPQTILDLISKLKSLSLALPETVLLGKKSDALYRTITEVHGESEWHTFNRRFDILFGEDCRDSTGRLHHVRRGKYGMDVVYQYLETIPLDPAVMLLDLMQIKLDRLVKELDFLVKASFSESPPAVHNFAVASPAFSAFQPFPPTTLYQASLPHALLSSSIPIPGRPPGPATGAWAGSSSFAFPGQSTGAQVQDTSGAPAGVAQPSASCSTVPPAVNLSAEPPTTGTSKKRKATKQLPLTAVLQGGKAPDLPDDDPKDKSYQPSKRPASKSPSFSPERIFDSDGEEVIEIVSKPPKRRITVQDSDVSDHQTGSKGSDERGRQKFKPVQGTSSKVSRRSATGKYKRPPRPKGRAKSSNSAVSSETESDGRGALREVEAYEARRTGKRGPKNESLAHWHGPIPTLDPNHGARWEFKCKYCQAARSFKRTVKGEDPKWDDEARKPPLGNLATHIREKHPDALKGEKVEEHERTQADHGYTLASAKLMEGYLKEGALNPQEVPTYKGFLRLFSAWILDEDLPFTTGEAPSLARLFKYLKISYVLPSDTTVRNVLAEIFAELHGKVVRELTRVKSKIAYSTDTWSMRQMIFTFAGTIAYFIDDDWQLLERLIDFRHLEDNEHKGVHAAKAFVNSASKRGGLNKIIVQYFLSLTMDNASANDVLARTLGLLLLQRYGVHFTPQNGQIRCLAHVVNLVVQKLLCELLDADDPALNDYYESNKHVPFHYDPDNDEDVQRLDREGADEEDSGLNDESDEVGDIDDMDDMDELDDSDIQGRWSGQSAVKKLRLICTKIVSSPQRRSKFRKISHRVYKSSTPEDERRRNLMVIRDVATRWNYTHAMIVRGLLLRDAIDKWVFESSKLRALLLSPAEWQTLEQLAKLLEVFTKVTKEMSRARTPTLPFVLPMYEYMRKSLNSFVYDESLAPHLRNAAAAGLQKLEEYYKYAKDSHYTILATMLHPTLRLRWFSGAYGQTFTDHARALFDHVYNEYAAAERPVTPEARPTTAQQDLGFLGEVCMAGSFPAFDSPMPTKNELDRYFAGEGGPGEYGEPLQWWKVHAQVFPTIARMARDFLAIPGTSVSVERLFSKSRHLCTDLRSSFKAETVTEAMCVKVWIRDGLLDANPAAAPVKQT